MKIIFLHLPKTAGQSVHAALVNAFGEDAVCPARVNEQLIRLSIVDLNRYRIFSGHLDWSLLDCVTGPKYVFTILREPMDRILSFYFYLREQAAGLSPEVRAKPRHQGLKAALELSPDEYFTGGVPHLRRFLDDHYDNFYAYYFAGRNYKARGEMAGLIKRGELTRDDVLRMAKENLSLLGDVYTLDNLGDVFAAIRRISGKPILSDESYRTNINTKVVSQDRVAQLKELGANAGTMARLEEFCSLDNEIWRMYAGKTKPVKTRLIDGFNSGTA